MSSMASGGPGKSNGNSNSPNDRELERKRQEAYDQLRRREEGNLILKVFRVQKYFFFKKFEFKFMAGNFVILAGILKVELCTI